MRDRLVPYPTEFAVHVLGVGGIVTHQNEILLIKHRYGRAKQFWLIPGGLVEQGETLEEAIIREIKEETNLDIRPTGIVGIRSMVRQDDVTTDVYTVFTCELLSDPSTIVAQKDEISAIGWFDMDLLDATKGVPFYTKQIVSIYQSGVTMTRNIELDQKSREIIGLDKYEQYWI